MRRLLQGRAGLGVAFLAGLLVATAGTATAARLITGKQIKDGTISVKDLNAAARAQLAKAGRAGPKGDPGPKGEQGPSGAAGAKGDAGPSAAFRATQSGSATVLAAPTKLATVTLPEAGDYVINGQLFGFPGGAPVGGSDQIICGVIGADDSVAAVMRSQVAAPTETTLYTVIGAGRLPAGAASLYCSAFTSGGLDPISAAGGLLTLTRVATLTGT